MNLTVTTLTKQRQKMKSATPSYEHCGLNISLISFIAFLEKRSLTFKKINVGYSDLTNIMFIPKGLIPDLDYIWMEKPPSTL